jgi:hypothetical protein
VLPACLPDGSSVKREFQALICEKPEVQSLRLTLPKRSTRRLASTAGKASYSDALLWVLRLSWSRTIVLAFEK